MKFFLFSSRKLEYRSRIGSGASSGSESGAVHFLDQPGPKNFCRLGVSSIPTEKIEPGIAKLAEVIRDIMRR